MHIHIKFHFNNCFKLLQISLQTFILRRINNMTSELSPIINTLILISAVLVPTIGWFGFYRVSIQTLSKKEHIYISTIVGLVLFGWLFLVMLLGMSDFFHVIRGRPLFPPVPNIVFGTILLIAGISLLFFSRIYSAVENKLTKVA